MNFLAFYASIQAQRKRFNMNKRKRIGKDHPHYKNGKTISSHGYVILCSKEWGANAGRYEHRVVMERHLGRKLKRGEIVHHKNGVKTDNRISNLQVMSRADHNREHGNGQMLACTSCGAERWYSKALAARLAKPYLCRKCYRAVRGKQPAKITDEDARDIRKSLKAGERGTDLARKYNVSPSTICDIKKGRRH